MENSEFAVCCGIDYSCGSLRSRIKCLNLRNNHVDYIPEIDVSTIKSARELKFYIAADMMMNVGKCNGPEKTDLKILWLHLTS